jgi:hypothetical protein
MSNPIIAFWFIFIIGVIMFSMLAWAFIPSMISSIKSMIFSRIQRRKKLVIKNQNEVRQIDPDKIAKALGAERVGKIGHAGGGHFGALQTAAQRPGPAGVIPADKDFQVNMEDALGVAGLPTDIKQIIGRMFQFQGAVPRSAERITIIGTVIGLEVSNQDKCVKLFISTCQFNDQKIEHLRIGYNESLTEHDCFLVFKDQPIIKGSFRFL